MIRILLWFAIILFILRILQLILRITKQPQRRATRTPEIDSIEEAHFEDITDLPESDEKSTPKK